mmetsp:Transcript_47696/g.153489  ORF Transcript_47696/g.153489 Transcript_47696/m.153489 type:complete len:323 (-) Transcript_47696:79-1047(-)
MPGKDFGDLNLRRHGSKVQQILQRGVRVEPVAGTSSSAATAPTVASASVASSINAAGTAKASALPMNFTAEASAPGASAHGVAAAVAAAASPEDSSAVRVHSVKVAAPPAASAALAAVASAAAAAAAVAAAAAAAAFAAAPGRGCGSGKLNCRAMKAYGLSGCSLMTLSMSSCVNSTRRCLSRYSRAVHAWLSLADEEFRLISFVPSGAAAPFSAPSSSACAAATVTLITIWSFGVPTASFDGACASSGMTYWQSVRFSSPARNTNLALATGSRTSTLKGRASAAVVGNRNGLPSSMRACRRVVPARTDKTQPSGTPSVLTT